MFCCENSERLRQAALMVPDGGADAGAMEVSASEAAAPGEQCACSIAARHSRLLPLRALFCRQSMPVAGEVRLPCFVPDTVAFAS